jgi:uncharacterized membrane protein
MAHFTRTTQKTLILAFVILSIILFFIPTGFERDDPKKSIRCRGEIISVDNSEIQQFGHLLKGSQTVTLTLLDGEFAGEKYEALNQLLGRLDRDKIFKPGDTALVVLSLNEHGRVIFVNPQGHYRIGGEIALLVAFVLFLVVFGRWTGVKAVLSFVFTILVIWKLLIPLILKGYDPILVSLLIVLSLNASIIFLVAGLTKMGAVAFLGGVLGIVSSCFLSIFFTRTLHLHGAILPFAETLLYSGFGHLNLTRIFIGAIFIASSGAIMDLSMDVASAMREVVSKKPEIGCGELIQSGFFVSRAVVGTMTTTLLFAYSGGYITLLMAFMAQNIPVPNSVNLIYVSAEIVKTLVGSFGLVLVAPFTSIVGGLIYSHDNSLLKLHQNYD